MKRNKKAAIAISLAAVMACGVLAGCDLITTDSAKNMKQVIAEVDITQSEDFGENGIYAKYKDVIKPATVLKRDLIAEYITSGYSLQQSYGWSYTDAFNELVESLVSRQIYLQYAVVYLLENGSFDEDGEPVSYSVDDYKAAIAADPDDEIAGFAFFLDKDEIGLTEYSLRKSFNDILDSAETSYIREDEDEHDHDETVRTLPTGVETQDSDYYPEKYDRDYAIYTGYNHVSECGEYEAQDGSTSTTRKRGYGDFLKNLSSNYLLEKGEDTTNAENLKYYQIERKSAYETALINKLSKTFETIAEKKIRGENDDYAYVTNTLERTYQAQKSSYEGDTDSFETALDSTSDSFFLFYAPDSGYGFVINILLPFSTASSQALSDSDSDFGDLNGNKFQRRAMLLEKLTATDQRGTWFTGHDDYSFDATGDGNAYVGSGENRSSYLFFEDSLSGLDNKALTGETTSKYSAIKNYYGRYTYNGTVTEPAEGEGNGHHKLVPNKIDIDGFITEMEGYLKHVGFTLGTGEYPNGDKSSYYGRKPVGYYEDDTQATVDYSTFLYYENKIDFTEKFNPSNIFRVGTQENTAMSVINELSFAYNTDTAGLNSYLGYAVSPYQTNFVKEFEYAAQKAVAGGAGTFTVAPSDYGWHIMYCTFSYVDGEEGQPIYTFDASEVSIEGTFSYRYFEALKASAAETYAEVVSSKAVTAFNDCSTIYTKRYKDLTDLDKQ